MTTKLSNDMLRTLRKRGFDDAVAGRRPSRSESEYMASYRRGAARRVLLQSGGKEEG